MLNMTIYINKNILEAMNKTKIDRKRQSKWREKMANSHTYN